MSAAQETLNPTTDDFASMLEAALETQFYDRRQCC